MKINPQFLINNDKPAYVVLPDKEYKYLIKMAKKVIDIEIVEKNVGLYPEKGYNKEVK
jgi:hypothetical protein